MLVASYGRRRGRRLRAGRQELLDDLLPRLEVALPPEGVSADPVAWFDPPPTGLWLEAGFGAGEHLAAQAAAHPEIGFIGAEPYWNGVAALLDRIEAQGLANIRVWPDDVRLLLPALPEAVLARVFVLFPDPWPKLRHHKRRLVAGGLLDALARVMCEGGELRLASDDAPYIAWMEEMLQGHGAFVPLAEGGDARGERPEDAPPTRYELKARRAGAAVVYLRFRRLGNPAPKR